MQGQVFVPYTGIGGFNMDVGVMPFSLNGSSNPGVDAGQQGTDINVFWVFPGGITNQKYNGQAMWAYAVQDKGTDLNYDTDEDVRLWLQGKIVGSSYISKIKFTEEQIDSEDPRITAEINELIYQYVTRLLQPGLGSSMDDFKNYFGETGCYVTGRK